jgi:broad specificity phosphatase PhoE
MPTTIILVRHGQTEWNRVERFRGRFDIPLNQMGRDQAKKTAVRITAKWRPSVIYTSPLSRAQETADIIAQFCQLTAQPHQGLIDIDYGKWLGLTPDEAEKTWPEAVLNWFDHPEKAEIPNGEGLLDVRLRISETLTQICNQHFDKDIVLVSHTVINRLLVMNALNIDNRFFWRLHQDACAINILERENNAFNLVSMNDTCHLEKQFE